MAAERVRQHPQRSCIACREQRPQRELIRLVRSAEGPVKVDEPPGHAAGRGAYLCPEAACWRRALAGQTVGRALRASLTDEDRAALSAYADGLGTAAVGATGEGNRP